MPQYVLLEETQLNHTQMQETNGICDSISDGFTEGANPYEWQPLFLLRDVHIEGSRLVCIVCYL
jgi:hypothetical protein